MNTSSDIKVEKPDIIKALLSGFNTIANKPLLIIFPVLLDLFLWFGPAWRVDRYFIPYLQNLFRSPGLETTEFTAIIENLQLMWQDIFSNLNLAVSLRTLPIGIPSLMVSKEAFENPLGQSYIINLENNVQILGIFCLFLVVGYFLANLYFRNISSQIITTNPNNIKSLMHSFSQVILMPFILILLLVILSIPIVFIVGITLIVSPAISQFITLASGVIIIWVIVPLVFTPHGIFLYRQDLISAMLTSINVVKASMGNTLWFIVLSYALIEGLDYLWRTPNVDNWFLVVGIFGHAIIVTAVITASFHYFIDATKYTQTIMNSKINSTKAV